jgi:cyclophilin family peptidyl-prolyl cis-trans isomerase
MRKPGFSGAGGQLVWYQGKCPVPRGPMARMPLRSLPMVRLVAMVVFQGGMRRSVAASAVTLAVSFTLAAPTLSPAQEPAAEAAATSAAALADLPPPTREEAEAARADYLDSERELKKLVGELSSLQTSYQKKGADRPALEAAFATAKIAAQAASERLEVAAMTIARAGIPKRGEVDDIDIAMPVYQGARKVCAAMVAGAIKTDDPEKALVLVDEFERVGAIDGDVLMMGATASMLVSNLDGAEAYLAKLSAVGGSDDKQAQIGQLKEALEDERKKVDEEMALRAAEATANDLPRIRIKTSAGDLVVELFENEAPNTVANFLSLVEKGFYAGTPFHRVIPEFMAQGGDPTGRGSGGPGYVIPCETGEPHARKHFRGSLSMAHAGKDTGGSQFFLTFRPTEHLDGKHTVFGRVIEGFEVLPKIHRTQAPDGRPIPGIKPDTILSAEVVRKRDHDYAPKTLPDVKK